jgi:hypothetical protein
MPLSAKEPVGARSRRNAVPSRTFHTLPPATRRSRPGVLRAERMEARSSLRSAGAAGAVLALALLVLAGCGSTPAAQNRAAQNGSDPTPMSSPQAQQASSVTIDRAGGLRGTAVSARLDADGSVGVRDSARPGFRSTSRRLSSTATAEAMTLAASTAFGRAARAPAGQPACCDRFVYRVTAIVHGHRSSAELVETDGPRVLVRLVQLLSPVLPPPAMEGGK